MKELSLPTRIFLTVMYFLGCGLFLWNMRLTAFSDVPMLIVLSLLASALHILKVEGATARSHYTFSFLIYGFTFVQLGIGELLVVILISNLAEWVWHRPPWYIQVFNISCYICAAFGAYAVFGLVNPSGSFLTALGVLSIVLGMIVFIFINHAILGIVLWLARGENFKVSRMMDFFPFIMDVTMLLVGCTLKLIWDANPFALVLFLFPLYLIYTTLRIPALERQTEIDSKTGLFNHAHFKKQLTSELVRANRFDRPVSVILADLDLLRNINNTYGHLAGDEVLIGIAKVLKQSVRDYDIVSRFGGEEFAILLPETSLQQAYERAEFLRKAIEKLEFTVQTSVTPIRATMSFGVSQRENFSQTVDDITHNADLALYHSKLTGRNRSFAFVNETYVDFSSTVESAKAPAGTAYTMPRAEMADSPIRTAMPGDTPKPVVGLVNDSSSSSARVYDESTDTRTLNGKPAKPKAGVDLFIGVTFLASLLAFVAILQWVPFQNSMLQLEWTGLAILSLLIILSEVFSVDIYTNQSSVSTSAIPILVAYLIFGPLGVVLASIVVAATLLFKYRSPINRFLFNFATHLLAGTVILGLVYFAGNNFMGLTTLPQIILSMMAAIILYLMTSWLVAWGMSLDLKHPVNQIWREKFSWLFPYYVGIGFISYAMIFGYKHDHFVGLLLMIIPMVLLRFSHKQYIDRTRQAVAELREKNQALEKKSEEITQLNEGLLLTLSEIIDLRDPYVLGHSKQVSHYATQIAILLGLNDKQVDFIRKAGLLHDIGKLGIPMEILAKPGKLTREEYDVIKEHAALGGDLVKNSLSLRPLSPIIRHHHEFYNGAGYPDRLNGNQISIEARIVAVADAIEAMISDRPYRKALGLEQVIEELRKNSGTQFDPLVVKEAVKMLEARLISEDMPKAQKDSPRLAASRLAADPQTL
jgi:diguanylate cyclase (GGDEF)-like protein/putative nucleotidyltransferase with HDIG domain